MGPPENRPSWSLKLAYVAFLILVGLGYVALQPPFEGYDEYAHFSSLRQMAHTASLPMQGTSYLDREATEYQGPMPYGSGTPPFRAQLGASSYPEFFGDPIAVSRYADAYGGAGPRSRFKESGVLNWQAQHPPLYYLLITPAVWATDHLSFVSQVFVLRLVSYLLAIGGVLFGVASLRNFRRREVTGWLGFMFYPLLLPEFFPEFARIGNDSLCLLLAGWLLHLISNENDPGKRVTQPRLIGLVLGCGLLTKAFFLPMTAATTAWFVICRLKEGTGTRRLPQMWDIAAVLVCASAVGGWWYLYRFFVSGAFTGGYQAVQLVQSGGMLNGLHQHFAPAAFVRGLATIPVTWVWAGTWSLARLPTSLELPLVLIALWVIAEFVIVVPHDRPQDLSWLTILMSAGFCFGLVDQTLQGIALAASGNSPGWYLHILMPWVAIAMGRGIWTILERPVTRGPFIFATIFAVAFQLVTVWSEAALFSGCAVKGDDKFFHFSTRAYCLDEMPLMFQRLGVVAWPRVALCAFAAAAATGLWMYRSVKTPRHLPS
jgi:hypothetical protein